MDFLREAVEVDSVRVPFVHGLMVAVGITDGDEVEGYELLRKI